MNDPIIKPELLDLRNTSKLWYPMNIQPIFKSDIPSVYNLSLLNPTNKTLHLDSWTYEVTDLDRNFSISSSYFEVDLEINRSIE